jgi:hypothetical protein
MTNPRRRRRAPIAPQVQAPYPFYQPPYPQVPAFKEPPRASVSVLRDKNATVANVSVSQMTDYNKGHDYLFEASGSTKREQGDRYDPQTGDLMAIGRALRNAGNDMITEANKRVSQIVADQAEERRRAAERRENKTKPVQRRTREEWERVQRIRRNQQLARNLGMTVESNEWGSYSSVAGPAPVHTAPVYGYESAVAPLYTGEDRSDSLGGSATVTPVNTEAISPSVRLSNDRYMVIEDNAVVLYRANGDVIMRIERA